MDIRFFAVIIPMLILAGQALPAFAGGDGDGSILTCRNDPSKC
jgi:hypothetical protein